MQVIRTSPLWRHGATLVVLCCLGASQDIQAQGACGDPDENAVVTCDSRTYMPGTAATGSIDYGITGDGLTVRLADDLEVNVSDALSDDAAVDVQGEADDMGDITIRMGDGVRISTDHTATPDPARENGISGIQARFNDAANAREGRIAVELGRSSIRTTGDDASGVAMFHDGMGMGRAYGTGDDDDMRTAIGPQDVGIHLLSVADIETTGAGSTGVHAELNSGTLIVDIEGGSVTTTGDMLEADPDEPTDHTAASAVYVEHTGTAGTVSVTVGSEAKVSASGLGAHGIVVDTTEIAPTQTDPMAGVCGSIGGICIQGIVEGGTGSAERDTDGIGGTVVGGGRGLYLSNGGQVALVGDRGLLRAASGVAVENAAGSLNIEILGISRIMGDIIGSAGTGADGAADPTNFTVNGIALLEDNELQDVAFAPAGPYDVALREERTGQDNVWTVVNAYSPRAAAFEALPQVLLQANEHSGRRPKSASRRARGAWFDITGGNGQHEPGSSTGLREYDHSWWRTRIGMDSPLPWGKDEWVVGAHLQLLEGYADDVRSSASPALDTSTGAVDTDGHGVGLHLDWWRAAHNLHAGLSIGLNWYEAEAKARYLSAATDAFGWSLQAQIDRTFVMNSQTTVTPRLDMGYSRVSMDGMNPLASPSTSARYRVAFDDAVSAKWRLGVDLEWQGKGQGRVREMRFHATPGISYEFDGETTAEVGLERLTARPERLWGEIAVGSTLVGTKLFDLGQDFELFGELSAALSGNSREFGVGAGMRIAF